MSEQCLRVVVADGHEIVREGIANRIAEIQDAELVGEAEDGYNAIKLCKMAQPDVLLLDLSITRPSGIETFNKITKSFPEIKVILLSSNAKIEDAFVTFGQGAVGYLPKQAKGEHFENAIRSVGMGYACIPSDYLKDFAGIRKNVARKGNIYGLSPRETEVLEASTTGASTKDIAASLDISVRTVETHRNAIYKKTSCRNVAELASIADRL